MNADSCSCQRRERSFNPHSRVGGTIPKRSKKTKLLRGRKGKGPVAGRRPSGQEVGHVSQIGKQRNHVSSDLATYWTDTSRPSNLRRERKVSNGGSFRLLGDWRQRQIKKGNGRGDGGGPAQAGFCMVKKIQGLNAALRTQTQIRRNGMRSLGLLYWRERRKRGKKLEKKLHRQKERALTR